MPLPDFIVVGAQKAGTSAALRNLRGHPDVLVNRRLEDRDDDEIHFFNEHWDRGVDWYASLFPERRVFRLRRQLIGEKSANYLECPTSLRRMHATVPDAHLIVLLRHPVDRAYSQWNHFNQQLEHLADQGWRVVPFETAFDEDLGLVRARGHYAEALDGLLGLYPRERVHIAIQERMRRRPQPEFARMLAFLGLRQTRRRYRDAHVRSYERPLAPSVRAALMESYAASNERLFEILGARIPEWE